MRSTDLTKVIFPVALRDIFFEEPLDEGTLKVPVKDWKAVVDVEHRRTFCVVSEDYRLVTNKTPVMSWKKQGVFSSHELN